jgi:hypothetical protein
MSVMDNPKNFLSIKQHDGHTGKVTCAKLSFDERFIVSAGTEGLIFVHTLDKFMIQQESKFEPTDGIEGFEYLPESTQKQLVADAIEKFQTENQPNLPEVDTQVDGMDDSLLAISLRIPKDVPDITDET